MFVKDKLSLVVIFFYITILLSAACGVGGPIDVKGSEVAFAGPLKVSEHNPRYFTDDSGKAIYLTGSHTWTNFKDMGPADPPQPFDYKGYLGLIEQNNHNFIRLWTWELTKYQYQGESVKYASPFPWLRTGPGMALDGKPKFDLSKFDQAYFDRLRSRVIAARDRGIYVSIMLFEGHGLRASLAPWRWDGHPFNAENNINGINGDPDGDGKGIELHTLEIPEVTVLQKAYVKKVIDTVNDLDNVLYEIANESHGNSDPWQKHMIDFIHSYEMEKGKRHPVIYSAAWDYDGSELWQSKQRRSHLACLHRTLPLCHTGTILPPMTEEK